MGPRALGNRSILADPRFLKLKNKVNRIKRRENFRPLCPTILEDYAPRFLENYFYSPFMSISFNVNKKMKKIIKGVVHVDNTVRPQILKKEINPRYYNLIDNFRKLSGIPMMLNTSLNIKGEPICCTPEDAIKCFLKTDLDYLVIGDFILDKKLNGS